MNKDRARLVFLGVGLFVFYLLSGVYMFAIWLFFTPIGRNSPRYDYVVKFVESLFDVNTFMYIMLFWPAGIVLVVTGMIKLFCSFIGDPFDSYRAIKGIFFVFLFYALLFLFGYLYPVIRV